ncbi:MAG: transposase [Bacilli bacterium]
MHVRRKYFEAEDVEPELRRRVLRHIRNLYRYERVLKKYDREEDAEFILKVRREKIGPIIDKLFAMTAKALAEGRVMPKSAFAGAITYMHSLDKVLKTFLDNPYLEPDNGTSERALRPITISRNNWMFLSSEKGGETMGILMTLV